MILHSSGFELSVVLSTPEGLGPQTGSSFPTAASVSERALAVGDVDCDGCPDVVSADVGGLDVFRGLGCG